MTIPHKARKRFGQNFLNDTAVIDHIVLAINPAPGDHLVEIGPGLGALTTQVLSIAKELDVVELDRDIIPKLEALCGNLGKLHIHQADALKFDFAALKTDKRPLKVFGNLPYNISTPLIFHLLTNASIIQEMHFMLQKEVVERLAASPGTKDFGRLSIMAQYYCEVEMLFVVPPESFTPKPKVDSAIVRLIPTQRDACDQVQDTQLLNQVVTSAFTQRRKTIKNGLKDWLNDGDFDALSLDKKDRAENLSVNQFVQIVQYIEAKGMHSS